jgi:hypothetical protein
MRKLPFLAAAVEFTIEESLYFSRITVDPSAADPFSVSTVPVITVEDTCAWRSQKKKHTREAEIKHPKKNLIKTFVEF